MLPHIHRATQKFYIFLIVYLTGCTPKETIFVTLVAAVWILAYKREYPNLAPRPQI